MIKKLLALGLSLSLVDPAAGGIRNQTGPPHLQVANEAWHDGHYVTALREYIRLLNSSTDDRFVEPIALQTGELFQTEEITADGRSPRFTPDGKLIAYESGNGLSAMTRIVGAEENRQIVSDLPGTGAVFSPSGRRIAYIKVNRNKEIDKAQAELDAAPTQGAARRAAQQALTLLLARHSIIILRELGSGSEVELKTGNLLKSTLAFGADSETVYFVGEREGDVSRNDIYAITASSAQPAVVTECEGYKTAPIVDPTGRVLLFSVPNQNPFPTPPRRRDSGGSGDERQETTGAQTTGDEQRQQSFEGRFATPTKFGIVNLATRQVTLVNGQSPALSPVHSPDDGGSIAYVTRTGQDGSLVLMTIGGEPVTLIKGAGRIDAPGFSSDGRKLAYQKMGRDDWEVHVINRDGKGETRVTREIQHDALPRFISSDRLLAVVGEPRHRRSYLYDLNTLTRTRLFHNNTVRTISPEYSWSISPDGSKVLISAERDGDTVSPERGVYLVHLDRKIAKRQLLQRLEANLAEELSLRNESEKIFGAIAAEVRRTVQLASPSKVFEYEKSLFDFDSKHISQPGNRKAMEYLHSTYKSFGYDPEYQWFDVRNALGGKTANVIASLRGTENPELVYVVSSHYDSVVAGPGADDDSSGTAALLEAARMLAGKPMPATVIFASFTGEEAGLLGSREFVRRAQAEKTRIAGALNNDMIGWANDSRLDNTVRYTNAGIRIVQHGAAMMFTRLTTYDARYHRSTDATAFYEAFGDIVGGFGSYPVIGNPHYHTATDLLETINHQLVCETSKATVAAIMLLASSPSPVRDLRVVSYVGSTAELSWSPSPEKSVRGYIVTYKDERSVLQQARVSTPRVVLKGVKPETSVAIKAVNARGLQGWDWTRVTVSDKPK